MALRSINCADSRPSTEFSNRKLKRLASGWNPGFCPEGSLNAQVTRLAEGITPSGVACRFCDRCTDLGYTVGGK